MTRQDQEQESTVDLAVRRATRRYVLATAAVFAAGSGVAVNRHVLADDDDEDNSGPGGGGDNSGPGGDDGHDDHDGDDDDAGAGQGAGTGDPLTVVIAGRQFQPANMAVQTGQTVTWVNQDDDEHTASGRGMDTGVIAPGGQATVTFLEPGDFNYVCNFHPDMTGLVTVTGESQAAPGAGADQASRPAAATGDVQIVDFAFEPASVSVSAGGTLTWTNVGAAPHTVLADWADSGILESGATFSFTFDQPGTFDYQCGLHPAMTGTVEVATDQDGLEGTPDAGANVEGVWVHFYDLDGQDVLPSAAALVEFRADGTLLIDFTSAPAGSALTNGHGQWELAGEAIRTEWFVLLQRSAGAGFEILTVREEIDVSGAESSGELQISVRTQASETSDASGTLRGERLSSTLGSR